MAKQQVLTILEMLRGIPLLKFGGHNIRLRVAEPGIEVEPSTMGVYSGQTGEIVIDPRLTDAMLVKVLLHEVVHAAIDTQSIVLPDAVDEATTRVITAGLFNVLMDNPRLTGLLMVTCSLLQMERERSVETPHATTTSAEGPAPDRKGRQPRKKKTRAADDHYLGFRQRGAQNRTPDPD